jgi:hypothetical protein
MQWKPINSNSRPLAILQPGSVCLAFQVGYLIVKYGKGIVGTVPTKRHLVPILREKLQASSVSAIVLLGHLVDELFNSRMRRESGLPVVPMGPFVHHWLARE